MLTSIPQIISHLCTELKLTVPECAKMLGISEAVLSDYKRGAKPSKSDRILIEKLVPPLAVVQFLRGKERLLGVDLHERLMRVAVSRVSQEELLEAKGHAEEQELKEFRDRVNPPTYGFDK